MKHAELSCDVIFATKIVVIPWTTATEVTKRKGFGDVLTVKFTSSSSGSDAKDNFGEELDEFSEYILFHEDLETNGFETAELEGKNGSRSRRHCEEH